VLEDLYQGAKADFERRRELVSTSQLDALIESVTPPKVLSEIFPKRDAIHVLAEIKRASPSKGRLAEIADPVALAKTYEAAGASAISVLTEERKFVGSLDDLKKVSGAVDIATLRKDFISDEYQLLEARANGASLFLLIVAGLEANHLRHLKHFGESFGMTALVETHSVDEVKTAVDLESVLIGVNARDLSTFETDRGLFEKVVELIPTDAVKVAESAVRNRDDVAAYKAQGADVVLVGEALVTSDAASMLTSFFGVDNND